MEKYMAIRGFFLVSTTSSFKCIDLRKEMEL